MQQNKKLTLLQLSSHISKNEMAHTHSAVGSSEGEDYLNSDNTAVGIYILKCNLGLQWMYKLYFLL